ncbi:hypothetical protein [Essdubovirus chlorellae]|nr:hypothetical protein [Chlorella virophage]
MDRLQALLNGRTPKIRDPHTLEKVDHATERSRLNNEDRKYNKIVYDNELKQSALYNQSAMPNTSRDIGVAFKINVYVNKLTQLMGQKEELNKILLNFFVPGVSVQKLRGTTKEAQVATEFFKKGDVLATYNELMLYIKTYGQDIIKDDAFKAQIFNSSFNPLVQLLNDTAALYPSFFNQLPGPSNAGTPAENKSERKIYETAREQCIGCYALFNVMSTFINTLIFRPIVKDDVANYIKDNDLFGDRGNMIFGRNRMAPAPLPPAPLPPAPVNPPPAPPAPPPAPVLDPNDNATLTTLVENAQQQLGRYLFVKGSQDVANIVAEQQQLYPQLPQLVFNTLAKNLTAKIRQIRSAAGLSVQGKQTPTSVQQATLKYQQDQAAAQPVSPIVQPQPPPAQPVSPIVQPQPAPPQPAPLGQSLRNIALQEAPISDTGNVWTAMDADTLVQQLNLSQMETQDLRAVVRDCVAVIKQREDAEGRIFRAKTPADVDAVLQSLPQGTTATLDRLIPVEQDRKDFIKAVINGMRDIRIEYRNIKAQDDTRPDYVQNNDERTLYGLGRERNNDLVMNAILDFENMARRQAREQDKDAVMELTPQLRGQEPKIRYMINKMRQERDNEPNSWGKAKHEYKQGIKQRAAAMPIMDEYDPKAEAFKKGIVMSGGCDTWGSMRGGMDNREWKYSGYGEVMNEEDTPFKRMLGGMVNPFAPRIPEQKMQPFLPYNEAFDEDDDKDYYDEVLPEENTHYVELEKPVDLDAFADQIRKNNENYKVMTGKMKNVKYKN